MNAVTAMKRIRAQVSYWRRAQVDATKPGPEVSWTIRGLEIAVDEIRKLAKESAVRDTERRSLRFARHWLAADLYRAVRLAEAELVHGHKDRAVRKLREAIDLVKATQAKKIKAV